VRSCANASESAEEYEVVSGSRWRSPGSAPMLPFVDAVEQFRHRLASDAGRWLTNFLQPS